MIKVWSQPWLSSTRLMDFHCEAMSDNVNDVQRIDETPDFNPGVRRPVNVSEYTVKNAVDFVIKYLNSNSDDLYSLDLFQVVDGTQQV